jgi:hypothetical protein
MSEMVRVEDVARLARGQLLLNPSIAIDVRRSITQILDEMAPGGVLVLDFARVSAIHPTTASFIITYLVSQLRQPRAGERYIAVTGLDPLKRESLRAALGSAGEYLVEVDLAGRSGKSGALGPRQLGTVDKALTYVNNIGTATAAQLGQVLGMSSHDASDALEALVSRRLVVRVPGKGTDDQYKSIGQAIIELREGERPNES